MLELQAPPDGLIQPVVDGMISSPNEWQNAGRCSARQDGDFPLGRTSIIEDLRYGSDDCSIYLRIDWRERISTATPLELHLTLRNPTGKRYHAVIEVGADSAAVMSMNLPEGAVSVASKDIYEMRISMAALHLRRGDSVFLHLEVYREGLAHFVLPPATELELPWSMMAAYAV